jgi:regulatory protein
MARIVGIKPVPRRKTESRVALDDGVLLDLLVETCAVKGIREGREFTAAELEKIVAEDSYSRCRHAALRTIERGPRTRLQLTRRLRQYRKYSEAIVAQVVDDMTRLGFLDEREFASHVAGRAARRGGQGPRRVDQLLRASGVSDVARSEALAPLRDPAEQKKSVEETLERWMRRRVSPKRDRAPQRAAAEFLLRRGFDPDIVWAAIRRAFGESENDAG